MADAPHARAGWIVARDEEDVRDLARGDYGPVFDAAADHGLPVFAMTARNGHLLRPRAAKP
ncbi:hypothetical protein [Kitasatospora sp. NPDC005856]|uniref:hypothetical protein n=1 Tax=Kitasatospora sp. NPDC005856 TaxID=3154566 RepID=UPI0033E78B3E